MTEAATEKLVGNQEINGNLVEKQEIDVTCSIIGDYGKWQLGISIIMGSLKLSVAWILLGIIFIAPPMKFWCKKPPAFENYTNTEWIAISKPRSDDSSCRMYDNQMLLSENYSDSIEIPSVPCTEFEYDVSTFSSTIVTEWNLVCSRKYYVEFTQVSLMLGVLIGNLLVGLIADRYGRRKPLISAIAIQAIFGLASAMSPNLPLFLLARFILAIACGGIATVSFVMTMEVVGGIWKIIIPILYQVPFGLGGSMLAGLGYSIRDWRHLQIAISLLTCLYLVAYFFIQESPRWLLATQQYDQAIELLEKIAKINGRETATIRGIVKKKFQKESEDIKDKVTFNAIFQSRNMRNKTFIIFVEWFIGGLCIFALNQHTGLIGKNIFLNLIVGGCIMIPASIVCIPLVKRFGCKMTIIGMQLMTAVSFLVILLVPMNKYPQDWPRVIIAGIGGFGLSVSVPALFLYTGELYPTVVRNAGVGSASMFSRLGSMVSPFVILLEKVFPSLPFCLLSALVGIQTILLCFLPDMKDCPLLDTIQQAEEFDKNYKNKKSQPV